MNDVVIHDKTFRLFISQEEIESKVAKMASDFMTISFSGTPTFVVVLNGAFVFASSFLLKYNKPAIIKFIKAVSYEGLNSIGEVKFDLNLKEEDILDKDIVLIEDIVDTGLTLTSIINQYKKFKPRSIQVISLFHKPDANKSGLKPSLVGFNIPNDFIIGFGLDYDGIGRNLPAIYKLK